LAGLLSRYNEQQMLSTAAAKEKMFSSAEGAFSLAAGSCLAETHISALANVAEKTHLGIFSENGILASGWTGAKYEKLHQVSSTACLKTALGPTDYLYDGPNSIEEVDASGNELARYAQGDGIDLPLAQVRAGTASFYQQDVLGSVTSLSSTTGTLANTYTFDAFGNLNTSSGSLANPFQYIGRDFDPETSLRYNRARYYDSTIGRFMSEDPIGFAGSFDFYAYAQNDPLNLTDPTGLAPCGCPDPPSMPPGVNLLDNIKKAEGSKWLILAAPRLYWFYREVRNRGPWDYKQITTLNDFGILDHSPYQDLGNFNFGMTGAAAGIELQVLLRGAGWAQERAGTSTPEWGHWYGKAPYGDDPDDQKQIIAGFNYYKYGCYKK
jgi:RHS repeat-associated protein